MLGRQDALATLGPQNDMATIRLMLVLICPQKTELYDMTKSRFDVLFSKYNEDFTKNISRRQAVLGRQLIDSTLGSQDGMHDLKEMIHKQAEEKN